MKRILIIFLIFPMLFLVACSDRQVTDVVQPDGNPYTELLEHYQRLVLLQQQQLAALTDKQGEVENKDLQSPTAPTPDPPPVIVQSPSVIEPETETKSDLPNKQPPAESETPTSDSDFEWEEIPGGIRITGVQTGKTVLQIPASIHGIPVKEIGDRCFSGSGIREVILPEGITDIGWFAFYYCSALSSVTIPASVQKIGYAAFDGCAPGLILHCVPGSYAEQYAKSFSIRYDT